MVQEIILKRSTLSARHAVVLCCLVPLLAVVAIAVRWQDMEEWWYARKSTAALRDVCSMAHAAPVARFLYGQRLLKSKDLVNAAAQFKAANAERPGAVDALAEHINAQLGRTLVEMGDFAAAVPALKKAGAIDDDDPTVHTAYALIFADRRQFDYAETQLRIATTLEPSNPEAWYLLGRVYNDLANPQAAVPALQHAIALAPAHAPSHYELGHALALQSQFAQAIIQFRAAAALDPTDRDCRRALGAALGLSARSRADYEEASRLMAEMASTDTENDTLALTLGQLHLRFQNLERASFFFQKAIAIKPSNADAWYNLSRAEMLSGRKAESQAADREFTRLSRLHNDAVIAEKKVSANFKDFPARLELSEKYRAQGNIIGAYWQVRTALLLKPGDPAAVRQLQQVGPLYKQMVARQGIATIRRSGDAIFGPPPPPEYNDIVHGHHGVDPASTP
jgi:tetratricopeptide (TPR) repeat protein